MAFDQANFAKISSGYAHVVSPQMFSYFSPTDDIAAILVSGYFDEINTETDIVRVGDLFLLDPPATHATLVTVLSLNPIVLGPAVDASGLADGSVTTPKLADLAVTTPKLENFAVTNLKIDDLAVDTLQIANDAVTTAKLDNDAVTTPKIADFSVTNDKIASLTIREGRFFDESVSTRVIEDEAVTSAKIGPNILGTWRLMSINEPLTGTSVTQNFVIPGAQAGDRAFAVLSVNNSLVLFILQSVFVDPNTISIAYNVSPGANDKVQIFQYRQITG